MDEMLINEYLSGDDEAINILIDRYKKPLYKLCFNLARNNFEADDLFQETWIKIIKNIHKYKTKKALSHIVWISILYKLNLYSENSNYDILFNSKIIIIGGYIYV
jgi:hypothetical protein